MIFLKKRKIKLTLIEDYIKILSIKNFNQIVFDYFSPTISSTLKTTQTLNMSLEKIYNEVFEKLKMNDLSLLILKKELQLSNSMFCQNKNLEQIIENNYLIVIQIYQNAYQKFKMLKLSPNYFFDLLLCTNNSPILNADK